MTSMVGGRSRRLALASLAAAIVAVLAWRILSADDDTGGDAAIEPASEVEPRFLEWAGGQPVGDELWVLGGVAGPVGSRPMISASLPEGWSTNRAVIIYAADGTVRERFLLPDLGGGFSGRVVADADEYLFIGEVCGRGLGCATRGKPLMLRFPAGDPARDSPEIVPLALPALPPANVVGAGSFGVVGLVGDTIWLEQMLDSPSNLGGAVTTARILAVDLSSGKGTEIPLPEGLITTGGTCILGDDLYRTSAVLEGTDVRSVSLHRRTATAIEGTWETVGTLEPNATVFSGHLECLEALDEVIISLNAFPTQLWTHTVGVDGFAPPSVFEGFDGGAVIGVVGGVAVAQANDNSRQVFFTRPKGGEWTEAAGVDQRAWPAIVGGRLVDVSKATEATHVPAPAFEVIDIDLDG